ncbi:MAG: hypothetical protein ACRDJU_01065 [Actinomycetota bacterium]
MNVAVLALGALAAAIAVVGIAAFAAVAGADGRSAGRPQTVLARATAPERRPSLLSGGLARAGASPSMVVGVSNAVDRGARASAIPVGAALLATVLALTAVTGSVIFGLSLHHLVATPRLYGDDYALGVASSGEDIAPYVQPVLAGIRGIARVSAGTLSQVEVDGAKTDVLAMDP